MTPQEIKERLQILLDLVEQVDKNSSFLYKFGATPCESDVRSLRSAIIHWGDGRPVYTRFFKRKYLIGCNKLYKQIKQLEKNKI